MHLTRRTFTGSAVSAAVFGGHALPAFAQGNPELGEAFGAIRAFGQADLAFNRLPGMTFGAVMPGGRRTVMNFGYGNFEAHTPITTDTLFQVGSITKLMVATILHQFAAEGRLRLSDRVTQLLPDVPLPAGNSIEVQHLLDHSAGLAADPPLFTAGGLWTGYPPGAHWHYSNTGYEILGRLAERIGAKPLRQLLDERIFAPLRMSRSRGAIVTADRSLYAQGYEAADPLLPYVRGAPLVSAPWVEATDGADCVASTTGDMLSLLQSLASAAQGRGGLGLSLQQARAFTTHSVPSDSPVMSYGNGLMHVEGSGRSYLHHTGGMLSFSSSLHIDVESGVGAFASATLNAFAGYRPRLLTLFAVDALTRALRGSPVPPPPPLDPPLADAAVYLGRYSGPAGSFEVRAGWPLTIVASGESAPLMLWTDQIFHTAHPEFRECSLMFSRSTDGSIAVASWGPNSYLRDGARASLPPSDPSLARFAAWYVSDDPWFGAAPVVERSGRLWIGTETPMTRIADNLWRVGQESWSPERASFADFDNGRPRTLIFSGVKFARRDP